MEQIKISKNNNKQLRKKFKVKTTTGESVSLSDLDSIPLTYLDYHQGYSSCKHFKLISDFNGVNLVQKTDESKSYEYYKQTPNQNRNYLTSCSLDKAFAGDLLSGNGMITSYKGFYTNNHQEPQNISLTASGQVYFATNDDHFVMEIKGQNSMRLGILYYDEQNQLRYNTTNEIISEQYGWQFVVVNLTNGETQEQQQTIMLAVLDQQNLTLYDLQIENNTGKLIQYTAQKPSGTKILNGKTDFSSQYLVTQDDNMIYFYRVSLIDNETIQFDPYQENPSLDLYTLYDSFNLTNGYIKAQELFNIDRIVLYDYDFFMLSSDYSEFDEEKDKLLAFYRIQDNYIEYTWMGNNLPKYVDSDHLGTLVFQGDFKRGTANTIEIDMDGILNATDFRSQQQISCFFIDDVTDVVVPINNANDNQISIKIKDGIDLNDIEEKYQCTMEQQIINYVDYYQKVTLSYNEEQKEYSGQVTLKAAQLSCELQAANYPYNLLGKLISNYIRVIRNTINLESCYSVANFSMDMEENKFTFTKPDTYTVNTCQIDRPKITATLTYEGQNYTHQMQESTTPSIQQLVSYEALFEPNLFPSFEGDDIPITLDILSFSPSGDPLLPSYQRTGNVSQELDTCYSNPAKSWLVYYENALHVKSFDSLATKYDKPCLYIFDNFDIFQVTIQDQETQEQQFLDTDTWSKYEIDPDVMFQYWYPKDLLDPSDYTPDMAHYSGININNENLSDTADFTVSIDDGDPEKIHTYQLSVYKDSLLPCILIPSGVNMYRIDDYIYLDASGNRNCNISKDISMDDITLLTESEECTFDSEISHHVYESECSYYSTATLMYEFYIEIYWKDYEIEEDMTMYLPVNIIDKTEINSLWQLWLTLLIVLPVGTYLGTGFSYWWYRVHIPKTKNQEETDNNKEMTTVKDNKEKVDEDQQGILDYDNNNHEADNGDILQQSSSMSNSSQEFDMYDTIPKPKVK